jgi:hypothetical protein
MTHDSQLRYTELDTVGPSGSLTQQLVNPGAVLEFKYTP